MKHDLQRPNHVFWRFRSIFGLENLVYLEATNSGTLLQHSNILETTSCTVMNLLLTVLLKKTPVTASKTLIIRDLKKLHNPGDGQVPPIDAILFFEIRVLAYLEATN